ncbi:hypothetical protein Tco_1393839 [Tanacetum coccineum]
MVEERRWKVFMDDFSVFGNSFQNCLSRLDHMLQRCEDTNLSLNWEKSHFMVKEGIVLGHKISKKGIEVDKAKIDVIAKLPHPTSSKRIREWFSSVMPVFTGVSFWILKNYPDQCPILLGEEYSFHLFPHDLLSSLYKNYR